MDVKNALGSILPANLRQKVGATEKTIKAGNTTDRDGNGQMAQDQKNEEQHPPMTEEQLKAAVDQIKALPAVKEHNLSVELTDVNGKRFVLLKEADGKILRRIPELELWTLPVIDSTSPDKKGQILRKTA